MIVRYFVNLAQKNRVLVFIELTYSSEKATFK